MIFTRIARAFKAKGHEYYRVSIPKEISDDLGIEKDTPLEFVVSDSGVVFRKKVTPITEQIVEE